MVPRSVCLFRCIGVATLASVLMLGVGSGFGQARDSVGPAQHPADPFAGTSFKVDPLRGPVDLGLTDPALIGAIDVHVHLDPDAPGTGGEVRALDAFEAAAIAKSRGMRGFVIKTHQDFGSAAMAYLVRKHVTPGFQVFGRMASNMSTGGINTAALEHFSQIKGGWGRIYEMPTRDTCTATYGGTNMDPQYLAKNRPWMLLLPPGSATCVAISKDGTLLPEVKFLIAAMGKVRTIDSNGRIVLATGHATDEENLLLTQEATKHGLHVLLTHPPYSASLMEAVKLGAFVEMNASRHYNDEAGKDAAAEFVRKVGAEHIVVGTDCGQTSNLYPTDCLAVLAKGLRSRGISEHELDLMYKINPAKLLWLPIDEAVLANRTR
jgi:hypothetical protein